MPDIAITEAVTVEIAKLNLNVGDILWVKIGPDMPFAYDWPTLHMIQHALQDTLDTQYPELSPLVIVAPGDAEPMIIRHAT